MARIATGNLYLPSGQMDALVQAGTLTANDALVNQIASFQSLTYSILILIALPLLLFSLDLKKWIKLAPEAMKSLALGIISLVIVIVAGYFLLVSNEPEGWKIAGMLTGVYTGGTPNLVAIATALKVSPGVFILTNTYDMVLGAFLLLFLMTIAQRTFNLILPHFRDVKKHKAICKVINETEGVDNYLGMLNWKSVQKLLVAFGLSVLIVAVSYGLGSLVSKTAQMAVIILTLTTLGLAASLVKKINTIENSFQLGMYFIIVFSLIIASMADLHAMFQIRFLNMFLFVAVAVFGSMIIHVGLSAIFKVDTDTTIITITGLTYSPPFVPAVAAAIRNKEVILTGIANGIIGYAIGNYLGVFLAYLLKGM
ncbi:MAG TPA: DUF819 family protein [Prolixibacteraceae bacterium]|nr:DUF819 family protein [Prolixibacteraceae bacterium]